MPVLIEQGYIEDYPLNHARIAYHDVTVTYAATTSAEDYPAIAAKSWITADRWKPTASPATLTASFPEAPIDYFAIGPHTLPDNAVVEFEIASVWTQIFWQSAAGDPAIIISPDNESILLLINQRNVTGVRVTFTWTGDAPSISKLVAGQILTMERPFYQGHSPAMLSRDTVRNPSESQGGEWLGTTIIRQGRSASMQWQNLKSLWYRRNFDPLAEHAQKYPFIAAWNPLRFASDTMYAMSGGDISPNYSGPRDRMSVSMNLKGYSDGTQPDVEFLLFDPLPPAGPTFITTADFGLITDAVTDSIDFGLISDEETEGQDLGGLI